MRKSKRALGALFAAVTVAPLAHWLIGELVVLYEMWATNAQSRQELGDDLGLGVLWGIVVLPGTALFSVSATWIAWRMLLPNSGSRIESSAGAAEK